MLKSILFTLGLFFVFSGTFAQGQREYTIKNKKAISWFEESENYMVRRQYEAAIELLDMALAKDNEFVEAHMRKAEIFGYMRKLELSRQSYEKVIQLAPDNPAFGPAYYYLAEVAMSRGNIDEAEQLANKFLAINPYHRDLRPYAELLMKNIEYTREHIDDKLEFEPKALPRTVNTFLLQYFPVLTADQNKIFFTARSGLTDQYDENIFYCEKNENGQWSKPKLLPGVINTQYNEGTCTISGDGRTLIFSCCLGRRSYGGCDLYMTQNVGGEWSDPENLGPEVNSRFWDSQPSISADGRTLYFISSRPGGNGQKDIYISKRDDQGNWSRATNLGKPVNTPYDELSPFIHANGQTLYFSSKGHPGFGGHDLFVTEISGKNWQEPRNLGYPLNTFNEQISLYVTADGKQGFYANDQLETTNGPQSEIYFFEMPEEIRVTNKTNFVKGRIIDSETKEMIGAKVELIKLEGNDLVSSIESDQVTGEYLMVITEGAEYALYVNKKGYLFKSMRFDYVQEKSNEPVVIDVYLDPIKKGSLTVLNNVFFDVDKYELKDKSITELQKVKRFLSENPSVKIGIAGHTDNSGAADYNKELSLNRAKAVYNYLVSDGINAERLRFRGYGQEQPVAPNDTEENKQKNRRIEFVIL